MSSFEKAQMILRGCTYNAKQFITFKPCQCRCKNIYYFQALSMNFLQVHYQSGDFGGSWQKFCSPYFWGQYSTALQPEGKGSVVLRVKAKCSDLRRLETSRLRFGYSRIAWLEPLVYLVCVYGSFLFIYLFFPGGEKWVKVRFPFCGEKILAKKL